jgi:hypothetical protein
VGWDGYPLLTLGQAEATKLRPMTDPYLIPSEEWMIQNVIKDMVRGAIKFSLVQTGPSHVEVWR